MVILLLEVIILKDITGIPSAALKTNKYKEHIMKSIIIFFIIILCSLSLSAQQEPLMKIYMDDGSTKQYNLKDIDSLGIIDNKNFYDMKIHYQDTLVAYYPTEIIGSIKFESDTNKKKVLNVYLFGYPKTYVLSSIDSIIFYKDIYQPLTIGSQVWMLKNLNIDHYRNGEAIPEFRDFNEWPHLITGAWCYQHNDLELGKIYGKLYNWFAVDDKRVLAPEGWHIPSDSEWLVLTNFLGGDSVAGGKLKEIGITHWFSPNTGATNESGFSALPGGFLYTSDGNGEGFWWSSKEYNATQSFICFLESNKAISYLSDIHKAAGISVRCIKDK
jgi:uncharacterized protein (TIGR02145 family)